ncbi:MAG TPA: hypothetical protein VF507_00065 [Pyrinomonadaceae bacterium]
MEEARDPKSAETSTESAAENSGPSPDATSEETLSDLEKEEKVTESDTDTGTGEGATPSPDGAFDDAGSRGDAGPM